MGRLAGASGAGRCLTRWAFALADVAAGIDERTVLILPPDRVAQLPPLRVPALAAAAGGARSVQRRQVLAALVARAVPSADSALAVDDDGRRRLAGTRFYASVGERAGWVAAALSRAPIGIDLESVAEANAGAAAVRDGIAVADPTYWHGLAGLWAAREATLKAMGRDLTTDPRGWRFAAGVVTAAGGAPHRVDLRALPGIVAAVAYVGD